MAPHGHSYTAGTPAGAEDGRPAVYCPTRPRLPAAHRVRCERWRECWGSKTGSHHYTSTTILPVGMPAICRISIMALPTTSPYEPTPSTLIPRRRHCTQLPDICCGFSAPSHCFSALCCALLVPFPLLFLCTRQTDQQGHTHGIEARFDQGKISTPGYALGLTLPALPGSSTAR